MGTEIIREEFTAWMRREMPVNTIIGDPDWWARKILGTIGALDAKAEQEAVPLKFPVMLRKMWTGDEVQEWLNKQATQCVNLPVKQPEGQAALARRLLWIAFNWNDHNFSHPPEYYAREAASEYGINNLDQANDWLSGNKGE